MKAFLGSISVAALLIASPAVASDIYGGSGGSIKDGPIVTPASTGRGGVYISGTLGYAWRDTDIDHTISREAGLDLKIPKDAKQEEIDELADKLTADGIAHRGNLTPDGNLILPLIGDILKLSDSDEGDGFVFGAGVQYLHHTGGMLGLSVGADVEIYGDSKSETKHSNAAGVLSNGNLIGDFGCGGSGCAGQPSPFPQSGGASVERNFDVDLVAMVHLFINDRFAIHGGGGISFARAEVCGSSFSGATDPRLTKAFDTSFCDDDSAIGPMLKAGFNWWMTDRTVLGVDLTGKWHDFGASGNAYNAISLNDDIALYGQSHDNVDAEDVVWALKGRLTFKLN